LLAECINLDDCALLPAQIESLTGRHRLLARVIESLPGLVAKM
jgi:hypothetical protein